MLVATASGDYRVDIRSTNSKAPNGRYAIKNITLREASATDKEYFAAETNFDDGRRLRAQQTSAGRRAAIEKYEKAVSLFHSVGDTYRQALTLSSIGNTYAQLNEFRTALGYFKTTISLAQSLSDRRLEASTETFLGGSYDVLGDVRESLGHYDRALALSKETGNRSAEASALNNIGKIHNDVADWQNGLEYSLRALPLFRALGNQQTEAIALHNIGLAYSALGEQEKALEYFTQALNLRRVSKDKEGESLTLSNIGLAFRKSGDLHKALDYYNQALTIQRETGNQALQAVTLDYIGVVSSDLGAPAKGLDYHQQALGLQLTIGNRQRQAIVLSNIGTDYSLLGESDKAIEHYNQALSLFRTMDDRNDAAKALEGLARVEQKRGDLNEARKNIEESLALIETVRARSGSQQLRASYLASMEKAYEFYVDLLMQQHSKDPGKGHDAEALQASERGRARSLMEMLSEAHVDIREGVGGDLIKRERDVSQSLNAKAQRQIRLTAQKGNQQEIDTLNKEISALEDEYQQVQVAIRKASPAYAALTQPQPLGLKEIQQQLDPNTALLEYSLGEERSYLWAVTQNTLKTYELPKREQIQKAARQVYESLTARSVVKSLETSAQRQERIAHADAQFQETATELSKMVLAPAVADLGTKRLVVVADGALQYVPFAALSMGGQLSIVIRQLPASGSVNTNSSQLTTDNGLRTDYKPLIIAHEVVSLPSASALAVQRKSLANRKAAPKAVAVIADPVFSAGDVRVKGGARALGTSEASAPPAVAGMRIIEHLAGNSAGNLVIRRLPFTRQEADQILAVVPGAANLKVLDFRANRAIVTNGELSKYRYVHFATHGYLDSERQDLSAIVLSLIDEDGRPQDGFLRAHEIYNLNLPAELVVLSACETGLGKEIKGEGLVGLTRGFMYAGARRVVVSLWNVNDKATAELMQRFYRKMLKDKQSPAASLRAAQLEMWQQKQWQSPYFWAAFVLQGEWK